MTATNGNPSSSPIPWHKKRASVRSMSARSILIPLTLVLNALSLALFMVVDTGIPVSGDPTLHLFSFTDPDMIYDKGHPILRVGTLGYCFDLTARGSHSLPSDRIPETPMCFHGTTYPNAVLTTYFGSFSLDSVYHTLSRLTPAISALHPLATALVFLVLLAVALPCFIPPIFAVALARIVEDQLGNSYHFSYGTAIWLLLAGAVSVWVGAALLTAGWWLRRQKVSAEDEGAVKASSTHVGELHSDEVRDELWEGANGHRHELSNTDGRKQGRVEVVSGAEERHELDDTLGRITVP
ncbi:hypothetical protein F4808DRAFT_430671 [Astrocystis sublimbata]|nr:hypothetical protein F4808DRAFT_430671 [Astrocystis sublimbata]